MEESRFWAIIEAGGDEALADPELQLAAVREELRTLTLGEIGDFDRLYRQKLADAYAWDLWGAAYLINGGCSDDGFFCFRGWLISRGRKVYEAALENPDSLAGLTDPERDDYEFEDLGYLPLDMCEERGGEEMVPVDVHSPAKPRGERWDFDDDEQVLEHMPRLAKVYLV